MCCPPQRVHKILAEKPAAHRGGGTRLGAASQSPPWVLCSGISLVLLW